MAGLLFGDDDEWEQELLGPARPARMRRARVFRPRINLEWPLPDQFR